MEKCESGKKKKSGNGQGSGIDLKFSLILLLGYRRYNHLKPRGVLSVSLHCSTADKAGETQSFQAIYIVSTWIWKQFLCVFALFEQQSLNR